MVCETKAPSSSINHRLTPQVFGHFVFCLTFLLEKACPSFRTQSPQDVHQVTWSAPHSTMYSGLASAAADAHRDALAAHIGLRGPRHLQLTEPSSHSPPDSGLWPSWSLSGDPDSKPETYLYLNHSLVQPYISCRSLAVTFSGVSSY